MTQPAPESPQRQRWPAVANVYARWLQWLPETARQHGYALAVHGSFIRDLDVIAVPWTEDAADPATLAAALAEDIGGHLSVNDPERKPHGRLAWAIRTASHAYLDLSVIPPQPKGPNPHA